MAYDPKKNYTTEIELLNDIVIESVLPAVECKIPRTTIKCFIKHLNLFNGVVFPGMANASENLIAPNEPEVIFPIRIAMYFNHFASTYLFLHRLFSKKPVILKNSRYDKVFTSHIRIESHQITKVVSSLTTELCSELDKYCLGVLNQEWMRVKKETNEAPTAWATVLEYTAPLLQVVDNNVNMDQLFDITSKKNGRLDSFIQERSLFFCENVITMIDRVNSNIVDIAGAFLSIDKKDCKKENIFIKNISVSNNDSHRHGKHVVMLELYCDKNKAKIVYKPSDIEVDCIVFGNSQILNKINHQFYVYKSAKSGEFMSIVELINKYVVDNVKYPSPIPTYKILPYNCGSFNSIDITKDNLNNAYGFLEFIEHYQHTKKVDIIDISTYWYIFGKIIALAVIIGTADMHYENFICGLWQDLHSTRKFAPYIIDLEASLNRKVTIGSTLMFDSTFGIYGVKDVKRNCFVRDQDSCFLFDDFSTIKLEIDKNIHLLMNGMEESKCFDYIYDLMHGVRSVSRISSIEKCIEDLKYLIFKLDGIVVRIVPIETSSWGLVHKDIFYRFTSNIEISAFDVNLMEIINEIYVGLEKKYINKANLITQMKLRNIIKYCAMFVTESKIIDDMLKNSLLAGDVMSVKRKIIQYAAEEIAVGDIPIFYMKWAKGLWIFLSSEGEEICRFKANSEYTVDIGKEIISRIMNNSTDIGLPFFDDIIDQIKKVKIN